MSDRESEFWWPYGVFAIDPGVTTGLAFVTGPNTIDVNPAPYSVDYYEEVTGPEREIVDWTLRKIVGFWVAYGPFPIVSEDFILQMYSAGRELLSPVRINARLEDRLYSRLQLEIGMGFYVQTREIAKSTVTDERLKIWNCYVRGEHARDACRHGITFYRRFNTDRNLQLNFAQNVANVDQR